jgi:hypothetical protein
MRRCRAGNPSPACGPSVPKRSGVLRPAWPRTHKSPHLSAEIERWLAIRRAFPGTLMFCSAEGETRGGPMTVPGFRGSLEMLAGKAGLLGVRVHPEAFRYTLAAELMVEQWPLPYIMTQLGIGTLQAFDNLLQHLDISPPPDVEVIEIMRARPPMTVEREP